MKTLLSATEAAKKSGLSRKTIQNYLATGRLKRHGTATRGRFARCIAPGELREVVRRAAEERRLDQSPVWGRIYRAVREDELDPVEVLRRLLRVFQAGADLDFGAYLMDRLIQGDTIFIRLMDNPDDKRLQRLVDPLRVFVAREARKLVHECREPPDDEDEEEPAAEDEETRGGDSPEHEAGGSAGPEDFRRLWPQLVVAWAQAPIDVKPAIVLDRASGKVDIGIVPRWCREAPDGLMPMEGGKFSLVRIRKGAWYKRAVRIARTLVASVLEAPGRTPEGKGTMFRVIRGLGSRAEGFYVEGGERELVRWIAEETGVAGGDAVFFGRYWDALKGDVVDRRNTAEYREEVHVGADRDGDEAAEWWEATYGVADSAGGRDEDDAKDEDDVEAEGEGDIRGPATARGKLEPVCVRPTHVHLAKLLGATRQAVSRWLRCK